LRSVTELIAFADLALLAIVIATGFSMVRQLPVSMKWFLTYLLSVAIIESVAKIQFYVFHRSNLYLIHLYTFLEFLFLSLYLREVLSLSKAKKKRLGWLIVGISAVLASYSIYGLTWYHSFQVPGNVSIYSRTLTSLLIIMLSVLCLVQFTRKSGKTSDDSILFWLNAGVVIYFSGSFVIFMAMNKLISIPLKHSILLWLINAVLTFIFYVFSGVAFLTYRRSWKKLHFG
jgi:hypothetical protein